MINLNGYRFLIALLNDILSHDMDTDIYYSFIKQSKWIYKIDKCLFPAQTLNTENLLLTFSHHKFHTSINANMFAIFETLHFYSKWANTNENVDTELQSASAAGSSVFCIQYSFSTTC